MRKTKTCTKCNKRRRLKEFVVRKSTGKHQSWCRACTNQKIRSYRAANPAVRRSNSEGNKRRRDLVKRMVDALKADPCIDCGRSFSPWQMHFDHTDANKVASVSDLVRRASKKAVIEEIQKCELVCACCHADRTYKRLVEN